MLDFLPLDLKLRLRGVVYTARHVSLQARGYRLTNRSGRNWQNYPPHKMQKNIDFILDQAGIQRPVETILDHGCGTGHYVNQIRPLCRKLIGVDIIDQDGVPGYDQYIRVNPAPGLTYVDSVPDESVDIVFVIASIGMNVRGRYDSEAHGGDWEDYFHDANCRQGRYFTAGNYLRVVKPGGCIIVQEWESYPEQRVGKLTKSEVVQRIDKFYPHADVPGFTMLTKGFAPNPTGPYIVYRKE